MADELEDVITTDENEIEIGAAVAEANGDEPDDDDAVDEEEGDPIQEDDLDVIPIAEPTGGDTTGGLALRTLDLQNFQVGPTGLLVTGEPTLEEWAGIGELLRTLEHGLQWAIGDWICAGEGRFGDKAAQVLDHTAWSVRTTAVYRWAASRVPPENRRPDLTFSHHVVVAELPPDQQREWLEKAATPEEAGGDPWSIQRLKREMAVASAKGTAMRWLLVVDCDDEAEREKLKKSLEKSGHVCRCAEATRKRALKVGKAARPKLKAKAKVNTGRRTGRVRGGRKRRQA